MRLKRSFKYSMIFFLIITFLTILFRPTEIGINDVMNAPFLKTLTLLSSEFIKTLAISIPPSIIIFFVYYLYILKPQNH